jgi:hypothetical protein
MLGVVELVGALALLLSIHFFPISLINANETLNVGI